ncbi:MAG: 3' terminal RNA ribose 2'-O-methyltransferase Hen1 [Leptospiraceae bacterium]|nr:3' terminal RNA ribose 2'-O-methyltransferase Hen1 [Leptospiraceae bacterium]
MLLTITTTMPQATDLGYLLHKHPGRVQRFALSYGDAHVFYPESTDERTTAALLLDLDPISLVRGKTGGESPLAQYVNDKPYIASSFLSGAISKVFGSALSGHCKEKPALAQTAIPLELKLAVVPSRGGPGLLETLFHPLGYQLEYRRFVLDDQFPEWGDSPYYELDLRIVAKLKDVLSHLYVLIPVLDREKHYYVSDEEVEKLLRHGEGWLNTHPAQDQIVKRYLRSARHLTNQAFSRLGNGESTDTLDVEVVNQSKEDALEKPLTLNEQRLETIVSILNESDATSVLDLGCGEGKLLKRLQKLKGLKRIVGVDVSPAVLEYARRNLKLDELSRGNQRVELIHGSGIYKDDRFSGFDAICLIEVIEHMEADRLPFLEKTVFGHAKPGLLLVSTPNAEYNQLFENLPAGTLRHPDHRFEWTRLEFQDWARRVAGAYGYSVEFSGIGPEDSGLGCPTQLAVFRQAEVAQKVEGEHG